MGECHDQETVPVRGDITFYNVLVVEYRFVVDGRMESLGGAMRIFYLGLDLEGIMSHGGILFWSNASDIGRVYVGEGWIIFGAACARPSEGQGSFSENQKEDRPNSKTGCGKAECSFYHQEEALVYKIKAYHHYPKERRGRGVKPPSPTASISKDPKEKQINLLIYDQRYLCERLPQKRGK